VKKLADHFRCCAGRLAFSFHLYNSATVLSTPIGAGSFQQIEVEELSPFVTSII